jgi:hypothetical protein
VKSDGETHLAAATSNKVEFTQKYKADFLPNLYATKKITQYSPELQK